MKLTASLTYIAVASMLKGIVVVDAQGQMVKMCLFYDSPSGHARSDPIINQQCASGHVHTFYGPQEFHPNTTYEDLLAISPQFSTSPFEENQSLYWHPSIYRVTNDDDGTETFTRVNNLESSPYYRWDNSVFDDGATRKTEAFPPHFRYIAASSDSGANNGGENGENMFTECCNIVNGEEDCISWNRLEFPTQTCDFLGIALAGPTCWNGDLGITNDHKNHMAYTLDGDVAGPCPTTHPRRLPQVQLFVRIPDYQGGRYQLSDGNTEFHFDFFNGWQEGKLQQIIDNCMPQVQEIGEYNPECDCTAGDDEQTFLTPKDDSPGAVCDNAVRRLIINEATDVTTSLPQDACQGPPLIPKSWDTVTSDLYSCEAPPTGTPATPLPPTPSPPVSTPVPPTPSPPVETPVPPTPAPPTPVPEPPEEEEEESLERWVVCGRGVGLRRKCDEGEVDLVSVDEVHEVRCCVYEDDFWEAFDENPFDEGLKQKCRDDDFIDVLGKSVFEGECFEENFNTARLICDEAGGRLCSAEELMNSCTKGTGCGHDREMIWTCTEEHDFCEEANECCSGICIDNECEPWTCTEEYEPCESGNECCSGICTGDGECEPWR